MVNWTFTTPERKNEKVLTRFCEIGWKIYLRITGKKNNGGISEKVPSVHPSRNCTMCGLCGGRSRARSTGGVFNFHEYVQASRCSFTRLVILGFFSFVCSGVRWGWGSSPLSGSGWKTFFWGGGYLVIRRTPSDQMWYIRNGFIGLSKHCVS